jgi:EAL domain-containing protein (putative c-di-GMP-specific phosphodiesterase class I)
MGDQEDKNKIINTIIMLAENMKIDAIAEGVETSAQLAQIKSLNCRYGQGFLFSRPVTSDHARVFLEAAPARPAGRPSEELPAGHRPSPATQ